MATLILSAVGSAIGGPIGNAVGALIGQQIDSAIFAPDAREGPRISDLAITTSTYGQPIPRHFGKMRAPGSVIWSTDLKETSETRGNGKGKPKTTTYSYSISFAVALSSRPIQRIGRIWADGNLLRGVGGDLKVVGDMRSYLGHGDQRVDPLLRSAIGANCPAFRDFSYVVFEDLQLADFGNRIPALTFEIFADETDELLLSELAPSANVPNDQDVISHVKGFSDRGGPVISSLRTLGRAFALDCKTTQETVEIGLSQTATKPFLELPIALQDNEREASRSARASDLARLPASEPEPRALRYFDINRDYQTSVQRAIGSKGGGREYILELPAAMEASGARAISNDHATKERWQRERLQWRIADLDPRLSPGVTVRVPDHPGQWMITSWEWHGQGIELSLDRQPPQISSTVSGTPGIINNPLDTTPAPSELAVFESPWDGIGSPSTPRVLAAVSSQSPGWSGASLYARQNEALVPLNTSTRNRAVMGSLTSALNGSNSLRFEPNASVEVEVIGEELAFQSTTIAGIATGANRIRIGEEIAQFLNAEKLSDTRWALRGFLRGRGGTEAAAMSGHAIGAQAILIDDRLLSLDPELFTPSQPSQLAAIGLGDDTPVIAQLQSRGVSRQPLAPVHPRIETASANDWSVCWTRRARGHWLWEDNIEAPLIEENEQYIVGLGALAEPDLIWEVQSPMLHLKSSEVMNIQSLHSGKNMWVRQIGTYSQSPATLITQLP